MTCIILHARQPLVLPLLISLAPATGVNENMEYVKAEIRNDSNQGQVSSY
jgi:hypothetical protein